MATYAIGDIQGCFSALERLLAKIQFDSLRDTLWFTGDIVNRGPESLAALRFVKSLDENHQMVLGNHDLHLLAVASGAASLSANDTLHDILSAPDRDELIEWLRFRPLLVRDDALQCVMTHAGLAPNWSVDKAQELAREVEEVLRGPSAIPFLKQMYGNTPDHWDDRLTGVDRLRCIVNFLTRMRYCHRDGRLDLAYKGTLENKPKDLMPWFEVTPRANTDVTIVFGHWAALNGKADVARIEPLDTGCVWGNCLTALRLEDGIRFSVGCG